MNIRCPHCQTHIEADASDPREWSNRGIVRHRLGRFAEAWDDLTEAIRRQPEAAVNYAWRGDSLGSLGEWNGAIADLEKAV